VVVGKLLTLHPPTLSNSVERSSRSPVENLVPLWSEALHRVVGERSRLSVLYSGGLDSSMVAWGVRDLAEVELVTIGVPDSSDLVAAKEGAHALKLPWVHRAIDRHDVERILLADRPVFVGRTRISRAVLVSTALALETATTDRVVCGQGADELFLGYAHFEGLSSAQATKRREEDLGQLLAEDWPRSVLLAERHGKSLASPFLDSAFRECVESLPVDDLRSGSERKPALRDLARRLGLPAGLAGRPKKAFQYGSGVDKLLRSMGPVA